MTKHPSPSSVVKVGDGRGFVIEQRFSTAAFSGVARRAKLRLRPFVEQRLVATAAHCLRKLPPATPAAFYYERTYKGLLGTLDGKNNGVWAECLFADPVADIAVLGCPDGQELPDQAAAYDELTERVPPLQMAKARSGKGWVLALSGERWVRTTLKVSSGLYGTNLEIDSTEAGMSGSPILDDAGRVVGIVSLGMATVRDGVRQDERAGLQPILARNLPGWLLPKR